MSMKDCPSIPDLEHRARRRIPRYAWEYLACGTGAEECLRRNREAFERIVLVPRFLKGALSPDTRTELFGVDHALPFGISAIGAAGLIWPRAETILAACMAVAEEFGETPATARRAYYAQRLAASVALDRQSIVPDSLGYNGDPSSARARWPYDGWEATPQILDNGSQVT